MLSDAQRTQFENEGYLVVEDLIDAATLAAIKAEYAQAMDAMYDAWHADNLVPAPTPDMGFFDKLDIAVKAGIEWYQPLDISLPHADITQATPMHIGPAVFQMATHPGILDVVENLLGPELTSNPIQHVRIKPPERQVSADEDRAHIISTDWHQDRGVTLESADQTEMITVWLAITDATVENGCLQVKPGMRDEMIPHCTLRQTGITETHLPKGAAVPTPVRAGGAVIFHPLTPHASLSNHSDGYRWSFDLRYNVTGQSTGREQFPSFVARSRVQPEAELKDWRAWKTMWEETRYTLAHTTHIPQHRWPSDGPYCA
jgi:ectoine hydroxylase-related dioxygenase (phytanoyl-CoA dioxygenase family)